MKTKILVFLAALLLILGLWFGINFEKKFGTEKLNLDLKNIFNFKNIPNENQQDNTYRYVEGGPVTEQSQVIDVVEKNSPSVVTVSIKKTQKYISGNPYGSILDPFGFFGQNQQPQVEEKQIQKDIGTGFVISKDGLVVTNKHVVSDSSAEYKVISLANKEYDVENIYRDPILDLAILKVKNLDIEPLILGNSEELKVGQSVIAIGTALGEFRNTVTTGVISGLSRGISTGDYYGNYAEQLDNVIQTDAAINPGNSGGPLLNIAGQVIGVNVATAGGADNISFAVPINIIKEAIDNFNQTGQFQRAFLGVQYKTITKELAIMNEIPEGAYLVSVVEDSPASKSGLQKGDIITKIGSKSVTYENGELARLISQHKVSDKVDIEYWRDGKKQITSLVLEISDN